MVLNFSRYILVFLLFKASLTWGFSLERTNSYLAQAQQGNLAKSTIWLRLGHYKKSLIGGYKSKIKGSFFLSKNGATSPDDELLETIQLMFDEKTAEQTQCKYPARLKWLQKRISVHSDDIIPCKKLIEWKKSLNAQELYLVFASSDLNTPASSFGHLFFRLHNPNNFKQLDLVDYGINYAAVTPENDGVLFALKGLFGMYPGTFSMIPFHQKMREYTNAEGRDIWEYKMNLSPEQVDFLIDHLLEFQDSYVPYYFLDENCSYWLLEVLDTLSEDFDFSSNFHDVTIPLDVLKLLHSKENFLISEKYRDSLEKKFKHTYSNLNSAEKNKIKNIIAASDLNIEQVIPAASAQLLDASLDYLAIQEYRQQKDYKDLKYKIAIARSRLGQIPMQEIPKPISPLNSHDSFQIYLSAGVADQRPISRIKFRRTFHDMLSSDVGISEYSHLEAFSAELQYNHQLKQLDIWEAKLLKITSTKPVTALNTPLSWKVDLGTRPKFFPLLEGGAGFSFDILRNARFSNFIIARSEQQDSYLRSGLGYEALLLVHVSDSLRFLASGKYVSLMQTSPAVESEIGLSFNMSNKSEIRVSYQRRYDTDYLFLSYIF